MFNVHILSAAKDLMTWDHFVLAVGLLGQGLFSARFIIQWIQSEKKKESVIPEAFWYFSLFGGLLLLVYSILKREPIIFIGQAPSTFIYLRNIYFLKKNKKKKGDAPLEAYATE